MSKKCLYANAEEFAKKIEEYFKSCDNDERRVKTRNGEIVKFKPYTMSGLCVYLGMTREGLRKYKNKGPDYKAVVDFARCRVENYVEEHSLIGDLNPTVAIFNLKNNFGWQDKQDVEFNSTTNTNINVNMTKEQRQDRIKQLKEKLKG